MSDKHSEYAKNLATSLTAVASATVSISAASQYNNAVIGGGYPITNNGVLTGTLGGGYPNVSLSSGTGISSPWVSTTPDNRGRINLDGKNADITVNGVSLMSTLQRLEERLNILHPNTELEAEWEELRILGEQYRKLEAKLQEQGEMWAKLKAMPPPPID